MGTTVTVLVPRLTPLKNLTLVRRMFDHWDHALSRFRHDSELSYVNNRAGLPARVSPLFLRVLFESLRAAEATDGIFDPTLLTQMLDVGYDRTFSEIKETGEDDCLAAKPGGGWRFIRVDRRASMVSLPTGVGLDFGGIAKGMAVDAALEWLAGEGVACAAVNAGGDLRVHGKLPDQPGWTVAVEAGDGEINVDLFQGALATSSINRRAWVRGGRRLHHILDPRTGMPVMNEVRSVSVAAGTCAEAEVVAKVALTLGPYDGAAYLRKHRWSALMVTVDGRLRFGDWPDAGSRHQAA